MTYTVRLDRFEGPLDLLLQLIEKQEIDIHDIPIAQITEQYLAELENMRRLDLDVTSEFIVMAAQLLEIKARMLLPPDPEPVEGEAEAEADPREELVRRLLEYRQYKEAARYLSELSATYGGRYPRLVETMQPLANDLRGLENVTLADLVQAFAKVLASARDAPVVVAPETVTVGEKMQEILDLLRATSGPVTFRACFPGTASRYEVVVTFLALLELIRLGRVRVRQGRAFGEIVIEPAKPGSSHHDGQAPAKADEAAGTVTDSGPDS